MGCTLTIGTIMELGARIKETQACCLLLYVVGQNAMRAVLQMPMTREQEEQFLKAVCVHVLDGESGQRSPTGHQPPPLLL